MPSVARPALRIVSLAALGLAAGWLGYLGHSWSEAELVALNTPEAVGSSPVTVEIHRREFGRVLPLTVGIRFEPVREIHAVTRDGIVTEKVLEGVQRLQSGVRVFEIDNAPALVIQADKPFFRDVRSGVRGSDVESIQRFLREVGFYSGPADGTFGPETRAATRSLWASHGVDSDEFPLGSLVGLPVLSEVGWTVVAPPAVGSSASGTLVFTQVNLDDPTITAIVGNTVPELERGMKLVVSTLPAMELVDISSNDDGGLLLEFGSSSGGPMCSAGCELEPGVDTFVRGELVLSPPAVGLAVAASAVMRAEDGATLVRLSNGTVVPIEVRVVEDGFALLEGGVEAGTRVVLP
jgi:hypothetical protein